MPSCSAPVTSSIGTLAPGWLTVTKATSSSGLDDDAHAWPVKTRVMYQIP
jgi:hypothetical protein